MTVIALVTGIIISTGSLAWGFAESGFVVFARWMLIFGAVWLFTQWRGWGWFSWLGLSIATFAAAIGLWVGHSSEWFFSGAIFALFAWDMSDFRHRMVPIALDDNTRGMERRHIARMSWLSLIGLFLASIPTILMRRQFTFEWGALLVVVSLFGVAQLVSWLRR